MKESSILKAISDAIEEYEENQQRRIDLLESKILLFEREREAFIRHLREGDFSNQICELSKIANLTVEDLTKVLL